jgi:hypothetical protein
VQESAGKRSRGSSVGYDNVFGDQEAMFFQEDSIDSGATDDIKLEVCLVVSIGRISLHSLKVSPKMRRLTMCICKT